MLRRIGMLGLRVVAAMAFTYAGLVKMRSPQVFADDIAGFRLLPGALVVPLALALPIFELGTGIWLFSGLKVRSSAFCGLAGTTIFLLALVSAAVRGLPVECGCFGEHAYSSFSPVQRLWIALGRDVLLAGMLAAVYLDACRQERGRLPCSR